MKPKKRPDTTKRYQIPIVNSSFRILKELSDRGSMNLNELTLRTGVAKSSVFRILSTLHYLGYIARDDQQRTYHITSALGDLANDNAGSEALRRAAMPYMLKLRDAFGETVNLGKLNLDKVTYIEVVPSEFALRLCERAGASVLAHASALGKAILAYTSSEVVRSLITTRELQSLTPNTITGHEEFLRELQRVRSRGFAIDKQETVLLANCIGAPILDGRGVAVAAMSISGPSSRFNPREKRVVESLLEAVGSISKHLPHSAGDGKSVAASASAGSRG
jgi:IclR family transcriptional regulator, acetate operon repressor